MPISGSALAQILSARIVALGAVPVTTQIQADNAENLLWAQLLALLSGENENLSAAVNPTGTFVVVNTAVLTQFPLVTQIALSDANFPVGSVAEVRLTGQFINNSAGIVAFQVGTAFGSSTGILFPFVSLAAASFAAYSGSLRFVRNAAGSFIGLGGCLCIDGNTSAVAFGTPPLAFAAGNVVAPVALMDTADPAASTVLFSRVIEINTYLNTQLIF